VDTHTDTQTDEGFMKYAVEMASRAMMYIPGFIKNGSSIKKLIQGIHGHTDTGSMKIAYADFRFPTPPPK
jgi:hypothetical protein